MSKQSRICREIYSETVKLNNEISKTIREQLVINDEGVLMFGDEDVKSPGQLGIKILQLIDEVKEEFAIEKIKKLNETPEQKESRLIKQILQRKSF